MATDLVVGSKKQRSKNRYGFQKHQEILEIFRAGKWYLFSFRNMELCPPFYQEIDGIMNEGTLG